MTRAELERWIEEQRRLHGGSWRSRPWSSESLAEYAKALEDKLRAVVGDA